MRITFALLIILAQVTCFAQHPLKNPVTINYKVEKLNSNKFQILFIMGIKEPYKIVSPSSPDNYWIKLDITFSDTTNFSLEQNWTEIPEATLEFDSLIDEPVRVHRAKVTFGKIFNLRTTNDFEVVGRIEYQPSMMINGKGVEGHSIFCSDSFKLVRSNGTIQILPIASDGSIE